ncbi:hypothetical protein ACQ4PT_020125 [Festuca glaucescens]
MMPSHHDDDCSSSLGPPSPAAAMDLPDEEASCSWDTDHVVAWRDADLPTTVFVRTDRSGAFHAYPALGGPFHSLHRVQTAVDLHARGTARAQLERRSALDKLSRKERAIREFLYYPDGTTRVRTMRLVADLERDKVRRLAEALLDKHNDAEGHAYELQDVVHWQSICEGKAKWYYHLNITVRTKPAAGTETGSGDLFFAEVSRVPGDVLGYFLSCFCRVQPDGDDNEGRCHGCENNGSVDMKHPHADLYTGGHRNIRFPRGFGPSNEMQLHGSKSDPTEEADMIKAEEDRIRATFDYLDDEEYLENLRCKRRSIRLSCDNKIPSLVQFLVFLLLSLE